MKQRFFCGLEKKKLIENPSLIFSVQKDVVEQAVETSVLSQLEVSRMEYDNGKW